MAMVAPSASHISYGLGDIFHQSPNTNTYKNSKLSKMLDYLDLKLNVVIQDNDFYSNIISFTLN